MAQTNPYYAQISAKEGQLADLEAQWAVLNDQWTPYSNAGDYNNPTGRNILAQRNNVANQIEAVQRDLEQLRAAAERFDQAVATSVAQGLTPEAAFEKAKADVVRAEGTKRILTYVGIGLLVLAVVLAIVYFRKKKKG